MNPSPFADPDADAKGYPHRRVPPCQEGTPSQSGCRVACVGWACVYLTHGNCPWPNWGGLTHTERDDYNRTGNVGTANPGHPPLDVALDCQRPGAHGER